MKNTAKLVLYFSISFILIFIVSILINYLFFWTDIARTIPVGFETGFNAVQPAWKALPITIFSSLLIILSYSVRKKMPVLSSLPVIFILACLFTFAATLGITRAETLQFAFGPVKHVQVEPGLKLTGFNHSVILLNDTSIQTGSRVVAFPGQKLIYQETPFGPNNTILGLPPVQFSNEVPWFIHSIGLDLGISANQMENRIKTGYIDFFIYAFSLIFMLVSMQVFLNLSKWPLANFLTGIVLFRFVLLFETFINTSLINLFLFNFLNERINEKYLSPLVFAALGLVIYIFTVLNGLSRAHSERRGEPDYD